MSIGVADHVGLLAHEVHAVEEREDVCIEYGDALLRVIHIGVLLRSRVY